MIAIVPAPSVLAAENDPAVVYDNIEIPSQRELVDQSFFVIDRDGNCEEVSEAQAAAITAYDPIAVAFNYYDMGVGSDGKQRYEVEIIALCLDDDTYFTYSTLYAKPAGNTAWIKSSIKHEAYLKKTKVADSIYYRYSGTAPSIPSVDVKATLTYNQGSYSIPEHTLYNPK